MPTALARMAPWAVMEFPSFSQLPWAVPFEQFVREADALGSGGACCLFVIDDSIPPSARAGYAALVIAYARANEPVTIYADGAAALLIREGGTEAGEVAARRVLGQMKRLGLEHTLRAGLASFDGDAEATLERARTAADTAEPGEVSAG